MAITSLQTHSQPWVISQLDPPNQTIRLEGLSAPHGRRRRKPIMETEWELRQQKTYYPGRRKPTRHHFGDQESDIVLVGRFMDTELDTGGAVDKRQEVRQFAAAARRVRVRWGSVASYQGIIAKVRTGFEDAANITYEITIEVDADEDLAVRRVISVQPIAPTQVAGFVLKEIATVRAPFQTDSGLPNFDVLQDAISAMSSVVSTVNLASATFLSAAEAVRDFTSATSGQLKRLLGGITQLKTAMITMQNAFDSIALDSVLFVRTATVETTWQGLKNESNLSALNVLSLLADLEVSARSALGSPGFQTIIARDGDTWESLATRAIGGPDGANALRDANGVRYGEKPIGGRSYVVPVNA